MARGTKRSAAYVWVGLAAVCFGCSTARVGVGVGMSPVPGVGVGVSVSRPLRRGERLGPNLLRNGSFEDDSPGGPAGDQFGVAAGWETVCGGAHPEIYSLDSKVRCRGRRSQRMDSDGYHFDESANRCYNIDPKTGAKVFHPVEGVSLGMQAIAQTLPRGSVFPGKVYRLTVYVRTEGLEEDWEWLRAVVYWLDSQGEFISESRQPAELGRTGTHGWRKIVFDVQAPSGADTAKIYLHHHFVHGTVWYDACSFRQVIRAASTP